MINGEGTRENSAEVVLDDALGDGLPTWQVQGQRSDGDKDGESPSSSPSRYSSCGESEFDRYCSANSVMGTPSLCGSDFGSLKSPRLGDFGGLENFSLSGKVDRNFEDKNSLSSWKLGDCSEKRVSCDVTRGLEKEKNIESERGLVAMENGTFPDLPDEGGVISWKDSVNSKTIQRSSDNNSSINNRSAEANVEPTLNLGVEEGSQSQMGIEGVSGVFKSGRYSDDHSEGETLSQYEHSEGEDSMYGYGTDREEQIGLPPRGYTQYSQDKETNNEKSLLMTSSVAYGSDDWDDFLQETTENPQVSLGMDETQGLNKQVTISEVYTSTSTMGFPSIDVSKQQAVVKDFLINSEVHVTNNLCMYSDTDCMNPVEPLCGEAEQGENLKDTVVAPKHAGGISQFKGEQVSQVEVAPLMDELHRKLECSISKETTAPLMDELHRKPERSSTEETTDNNAGHVTSGHLSLTSREAAEDEIAETLRDRKLYSLQPSSDHDVERRETTTPSALNVEVAPVASKGEDYELDEFFDEVVHEMEEILMDSGESPAARFTHGRKNHSRLSLPSRDGGSTASTSSLDDVHSLTQNPYRIDNVEVIGARQKKGDVSLGERLVGVKEYTVYKLRVWSGTNHWDVERRYRDFYTLYRRLKMSFASKGWDLPSPWLLVDRESRKFFGNASPDVVSARSVLIQKCLQSILCSRFSSSLPSSLQWFLSPPTSGVDYPAFDRHNSQRHIFSGSSPTDSSYTLGQSISLIVEIKPHKSMEQMLEAQHYSCAGCHKHFDEGKTRIWEFVQTLGWGNPRLCEYSGQLFCSSCHVNETAILPARVLHLWDFTEYPVSQLAKSYLDSIHDQPMLCVGAVNPFLFSKVPALQHVTNVRKRIGRMLPYVRCPFRRSIYKGVGSRKYILESNDFFALKDLIDLSKGVFAALPVLVETISRRIVEHITDECLVCYDVGVPCSARQACDDPCSLIFPFQEGEVERCRSCELVYHKACFKKIETCPCGVGLGATAKRNPSIGANEVDRTSNNFVKKTDSKSSMGFLSGLLSKASPAKLLGPKDNDTVISMGSLPSSSL